MEMEQYTPRFKTRYHDEVVPALRKQFGYKNIMQVPRLMKITVNKGVGEAVLNQKLIDNAVEELRLITGQHPSVRRARKSVSNFKLREGMAVGAAVTMRGERMWEFLDRLITLALPRVRDFRGVPPGDQAKNWITDAPERQKSATNHGNGTVYTPI